MDKMNFYHRMFDVALKACGDCDIITRYDMQFNTLHRIYSARVWTVRGRIFDVTEEEYSHGENFTVTEVDTNQINWNLKNPILNTNQWQPTTHYSNTRRTKP